MKIDKLSVMTNGWFIGAFEPTVFYTKEFEVGVKHYSAGDSDPKHVHYEAEEISVIITGEAIMNGIPVCAGDIISIKKGEISDFKALSDVSLVAVKVPCVVGDKHLIHA